MIDTMTNKKFFLETYGCQMNEYDTELIKAILVKENFAFVPREDDADVVMLNTCAIRENAHRKVYGRVHDIHHRRQGRPVTIGILGCMATNLRQELFENRNLKIDFIAGPDSYKRLPALIREATTTGEKVFDVTLSEFENYSDIFPSQNGGNSSASPQDNFSHTQKVNSWIAIMRGCNNFCTFCVVPYTRGRERSRSLENIVAEVHKLAAEGFKQVTLLGQNVNSYNHEGADFAALLQAVSKVDGIERIRFTSPHPKDFPDSLLHVMANNTNVCKHIHLPLQSGNDRVLDMMNRTYTQKEFLDLVLKIRTLMPNVVLSTDMIVGFPTETDEEFEDTLRVVREVQFDSAFTFKYSERKGTIASKKYPDDVSEAKKTERIMRLIAIQREISLQKNRAHIGEVYDILIESSPAEQPSEVHGRTDGHKIVVLAPGNYKAGEFIKVKITDATPNALKGIHVDGT